MAQSRHRPHDAAATRRALLDAAAALFLERGYDRATVRDIGERAGVDPALIARYFDGKEGLYLAALADEETGPHRADIGSGDLVEVMQLMFAHWDERGMSPAMRALNGPRPNDEALAQARSILISAMVEPVGEHLAQRGLSEPRLRAELLLAMMAGVEVARSNGVLPELADIGTAELLELLKPIADALQR